MIVSLYFNIDILKERKEKMSQAYKDDVMEYIESDIDKIKMKTGMYISYVGEKGALHLAKEVIQNSIDECANPKSPAKTIDVILDLLSDTISVEDDGRGIPEDTLPMDILCTRLNSGSKFTREQGGATSGENGVGLIVSPWFFNCGELFTYVKHILI